MRPDAPSQETLSYAEAMARARVIAKGPDLFHRSMIDISGQPNALYILRRWNSHTPSVLDVMGGGYLLRWNNKGTVIDPGCSFIQLLQSGTPYGFGHINMVVTTHDHMDHCQDFDAIITLLRQYNRWGLEESMPARPARLTEPHTLDLVMSHGVAMQYASILDHPENEPFLRYSKVLPPCEVKQVQGPPKVAFQNGELKVGAWPAHLKEFCRRCNKEIRDAEEYLFRLHALSAKHSELLGHQTSMGLRFELCNASPPCTIVISGDTGTTPNYNDSHSPKKLAEQYISDSGLDLLVLHVGSMERLNSTNRLEQESEHLGMMGTVEILREIAEQCAATGKRLPKAIVLTEWGYEFGRSGQSGRSEFTKLVASELYELGYPQFFAAVEGGTPHPNTNPIPIIPADIALRFSLPDLKVWCTAPNEGWIPPSKVRAVERCPEITYESVP